MLILLTDALARLEPASASFMYGEVCGDLGNFIGLGVLCDEDAGALKGEIWDGDAEQVEAPCKAGLRWPMVAVPGMEGRDRVGEMGAARVCLLSLHAMMYRFWK
mmetsp:Transcript_30572/g.58909  ORF Transcript_30572/g.58909 Transcript_30572/m.58909 type:complete len:104 (-) Transcript_30572:812-1123(-)